MEDSKSIKSHLLTTEEIIKRYGSPGDVSNLTVIALPYPMRIAWDLQHRTSKMQCHKMVADNFKAVFNEILKTYGYDKIKELGIDLYGGCYNFRPMRGQTKTWSLHSWGIALDLSPDENGLHTPFEKAKFYKPEYKQMIDIFYKHNFVNLGVEIGRDTMHWQISS